MTWVILNHECVLADRASISIKDRGFLFGDGVFTSVKVENGRLLHWDRHCERVTAQCKTLHILPPDIKQSKVEELIERNGAEQGVWKLKIVITGGIDSRLSLPTRTYGTYLVTLEKYEMPEGKAKLCRYPYPIESPASSLKTLAYLPRLMVKQYALERGFDDAVVCSSKGWVLESAFSNLYWEEGGAVFTPMSTLPLLAGTYLTSIDHLKEERITYEQLKEKQAVFICNAMGSRLSEII